MSDFTIRVYGPEGLYTTTVQAETAEEAKEIARQELYDKYVAQDGTQKR